MRRGRGATEEQGDGFADWAPDRHRTISGEEVLELLPALASARADRRLPVLRLPDRRLAPRAHRPRRGGALRRGVRQRPRGHRARRGEPAARAGVRVRRHRDRRRVRRAAPPTSSTRPACGPTGCAPRSSTTRPRSRSSAPAAAPTSRSRRDKLPLVGGAIVPAGGGRSIFALPWLGAHADRHDRQRLRRRRPRPHPPGRRRTSSTCSRPPTSTSPRSWSVDDIAGAYAGRPAADLHRATRASPSTSRARPSCTRPRAG